MEIPKSGVSIIWRLFTSALRCLATYNTPRSPQIILPEKQKIFYNLLEDYWKWVRDHLISMHKDLQATERRNR